LDEDVSRGISTSLDLQTQLHGRTANLLEGALTETVIQLVPIFDDSRRRRGFGLKFSMNGSRPITLLLDTGAAGIVIHRKAAERSGIDSIGGFTIHGTCDKGGRESHAGIAETCSFSQLKFQNCIVTVIEAKHALDVDGLVGTDYFARYLVELDFQNCRMRLTPHPELPSNSLGYDRTLTPGFTPVLRFGHSLMVLTRVNDAEPALFLIDTGSSQSAIDRTFASEITSVHSDDTHRVRGISGRVDKVFEAGEVWIHFAGFRQKNIRLTAYDLNHIGQHSPVRRAGILGMQILNAFRLTLDYRNGQVKFEYINGPSRVLT
jgi:predicted aspartyl protease